MRCSTRTAPLQYSYNFLGIGDERHFIAELPSTARHIFGIGFDRQGGVDEVD
jgi:hypothetical protein